MGVNERTLTNLDESLGIDTSVISQYTTGKRTSCRYNYVLAKTEEHLFKHTVSGGNIYLGIEPNWLPREGGKSYKHVVLEFNPNKVSISDFKALKELAQYPQFKIDVMSIDVAVDLFDYSIEQLIINKRHGNELRQIIEHNKLETVYLGAFGESGHIKIYDKAKEQKLSDNFKWTRFEITYKKLGFLDLRETDVILNTKLPDILINDNSQVGFKFDELKPTDKYIFMTSLLKDGYQYLNLLDYRVKNKIKKLHKEFLKPIVIDVNELANAYKYYILK